MPIRTELQSYAPSRKGSKHFSPDSRIIVVDKSYLLFKRTGANLYAFDFGGFDGGDVFESKSHMRKLPDSFWQAAELVDPRVISGWDKISSENRTWYFEWMKKTGVA